MAAPFTTRRAASPAHCGDAGCGYRVLGLSRYRVVAGTEYES